MNEGVLTAVASMALLFSALPASNSYELQTYGIGSGGTSNSSSPTYRLNGSSGETGGTSSNGTTTTKTGSTETRQANVPLAPTLSNGSNTYVNKLDVSINKGGPDAPDYTYSIAVSTDDFVTSDFVQPDGTLASSAVYQTYTAWGSATGSTITGLSPNTTYKVRVNAMQSSFTASEYGPAATSATTAASLNFSITPTFISFGNLLPGAVTDADTAITIGFGTTSAGGAVYVAGANVGLKSAGTNAVIPSVDASLGSASQGFGLQGQTATQSSGGPFSFIAPFNGNATAVGDPSTTFKQLLTTPAALVEGSATVQAKAKAATSTPSGSDYSETLTFIAAASY
jgi:hypothetical protein